MLWFTVLLVVESGVLACCFDTTLAQYGCTSFTTKVSRDGGDEITVRFSLPHHCWADLNLRVIVVSRRVGASAPSTLCQIMNDTRDKTAEKTKSACPFDANTEEYRLVRKLDWAKRVLTETLEFRAESYNSSLLVTSTIQLTWEDIQSSSINTTDLDLTSNEPIETKTSNQLWVSDYTLQEYSVSLTTTSDHQSTLISEETSEIETLRNDDQASPVSTSFTQSPAFGIIVILAFVGVIIVLIVIWIKQKRISWLRLARRSRKSFGKSIAYDQMFRQDTVSAVPMGGLGMDAADAYDLLPPHNTAAPASHVKDQSCHDVFDTVPCPPTPRSYEFRAVSVQVNRDSLLNPLYATVNDVGRQAINCQSTPKLKDDE